MSDAVDLSQNEFLGAVALALEGNGLPQSLCRTGARAALGLALDGDATCVERALGWTAGDVASMALARPTSWGLVGRRVRCLNAQQWAQVKVLAAKTYVPETAASRTSGAGAGDTDND